MLMKSNEHKNAILAGDPKKVVDLLMNESLNFNDSRTAKSHNGCASLSETKLYCSMCGKPIKVDDEWLRKASLLDLNRLACSEHCRSELRELRADNHWS